MVVIDAQTLLTQPQALLAHVQAALARRGGPPPRELPAGVRRAAVLLVLVPVGGGHRVLEVPLRTLLDPRNLRTELWDHEGASRIIYFYTVGADVVWGATARVITQFLRRVFPAVIPPDGDLPAARRRE